jgi:Cu-Zn family superoxide dismutase
MRSRLTKLVPPAMAIAALAVYVQAQTDAPKARPDTTLLSTEQKSLGKPQMASRAVSVLIPVGDSSVHGTVFFEQTRGGLRITGTVSGLKPGKHGFHVHQYGDLTSTQDGESAGGHFNPTDMPHGRPHDEKRHAGDFGNIEANQRGVAHIDKLDPVAKLNGPYSILGRGLIVHANPDDFTQPTGNAGARVAMGVIGVANPKTRLGEPSRGERSAR